MELVYQKKPAPRRFAKPDQWSSAGDCATKLPVYQLGGVERRTLLPGDQGTRQTLEAMARLSREGAKELEVRAQAIAIVKRAGIHPNDLVGEIRALFEFVRDRVRFLRDPVDLELVQAPRVTLRNGVGDCDDKATLLAALLRAIGHRARIAFRAVATRPQAPSVFSHVYVVTDVDGRRLALDPTHRRTPLGWQYPASTRALELAL